METFKIAVSRYALTKKIPQGDPFWSTFNASFENVELPTGQIMRAIYQGRSITTQHKDHWRDGKNYLMGQHLGLDFDTGDRFSTLNYLINDKFVSKYASFVYTTISHTDESPRARVIFLLDQPITQAKNYTLAAAALLWLFGTADRQCKDAVRFFYGAPKCQFEMLDNVLPLDVVKKLICQYQETGIQEKRKAEHKDYHAPADQREIADALHCIPPWQIDYDEWLQILMAIHSELGDSGFALAENWAQGYDGEVEKKWKGFKTAGNTSGAITIATLFGIAKRFDWKKSYANLS